MDPRGRTAVIFGKRRRGRAAIAYLLDAGVSRLCLVSRDPSRHNQLPQGVELISYADLAEIEGQLLVNTTPVGMYPKVGFSPVGPDILDHFQDLADMVYNPTETEFLRLGKSLGKRTVGGCTCWWARPSAPRRFGRAGRLAAASSSRCMTGW